MKKLGTYLAAILMTVCSMLFAVSPAFAAGTNVSSGFSWTVGNSYTNVSEWSSYDSQGCGVSVSYDSNQDGYDYRRENYSTSTHNGSASNGSIVGGYVALDHSSSAGILRSSTGVRAGFSYSEMETDAWGQTNTNGSYVQRSGQDGAYNREHGSFSSSSGYGVESYADSLTLYASTYSSTEFDY